MKNVKDMQNKYKSTISFWSDANNDTFDNEMSSMDSDLSFTSNDVCNLPENTKSQNIKFIIREITRNKDSFMLKGDDVICTVKGQWCNIEYNTMTKVTILGCICCDNELTKVHDDGYIRITVDDNHHLLFIEDDLMTITNMISAIRCINNPYVNTRVADLQFGYNNQCMIMGTILHDVMEACLLTRDYSLSFIMANICKGIQNNLMSIYSCNINEKTIKDNLMSLIKNIKAFEKHNLVFDECEKQIVSLTMNLKGNIDATSANNILEIKSGKYIDVSHKAQLILYSLIMKEKYGSVLTPYLYYISDGNLLKIDIKHNEVKSLMVLRNQLTCNNKIHDCECMDFETCRILTKIQNLSDIHFLKKMLVSIELEEKHRMKETWHSVKLKKQVNLDVFFVYDRKTICINDLYINIYTEDFIKICKGIITKVEETLIQVELSEKINLESSSLYYINFGASDMFYKFMRYSLTRIAYFRYIGSNDKSGFLLPSEENGLEARNEPNEDVESDVGSHVSDNMIFSSDEIEMTQIEVQSNQTETGCKNKRIKHDDGYDTNSSFMYFTPPASSFEKYRYSIPKIYLKEFLKLNDDQKCALFTSLNCKNYKIIHGMPGTGKSTVIRLLIKILIHYNKKVLLVCFTNLAISNILCKLETTRTYRAGKENIKFNSVKEIESYFSSVDLVASTCFGFRDPIFIERKFDFCIIDEGSQQHLLLTLIPVSRCDKFVIFGDHLQLKPLSKASSDLSLSLFEYLLDEHHSKLVTQYRMGENIMRLSNSLFYDEKLQSGVDIAGEVIFIDSSKLDYDTFMGDVKNSVILCYFNSQVRKTKELTSCQVETVDRFQGSEFENVVVVFDPVVRCEVLESKERLNVALTRAKKSLILIGNLEQMKEIDIMYKLLQLLNVI